MVIELWYRGRVPLFTVVKDGDDAARNRVINNWIMVAHALGFTVLVNNAKRRHVRGPTARIKCKTIEWSGSPKLQK